MISGEKMEGMKEQPIQHCPGNITAIHLCGTNKKERLLTCNDGSSSGHSVNSHKGLIPALALGLSEHSLAAREK